METTMKRGTLTRMVIIAGVASSMLALSACRDDIKTKYSSLEQCKVASQSATNSFSAADCEKAWNTSKQTFYANVGRYNSMNDCDLAYGS